MAISAVVDSLDSLTEGVKEHFVAGTGALEGKFVLEVTPVDGVDLQLMPQAGLKSALESERKITSDLKQKLHEAGKVKIDDAEYDEAAVRQLIEKATKLEEAGGDPDGKLAALRADLESQYSTREKTLTDKYNTEMSGSKDELTRIQGIMKNSAIDAEIMRAMQKHKGNSKLLAPHVRSQLNAKVDGDKVTTFVAGSDGNPRISMLANNADNMSVDEFVGSMKTDPDFSACFEGTGASGTGGQQSGIGGGKKASSDAPISERVNSAFD